MSTLMLQQAHPSHAKAGDDSPKYLPQESIIMHDNVAADEHRQGHLNHDQEISEVHWLEQAFVLSFLEKLKKVLGHLLIPLAGLRILTKVHYIKSGRLISSLHKKRLSSLPYK